MWCSRRSALRRAEFCDSGTLKAAIDDGKLHDLSSGAPRPVMSHILQLATDIAAGMSHVHSRRVVHGDLTPANVLLKSTPSTVSGLQAKVAGARPDSSLKGWGRAQLSVSKGKADRAPGNRPVAQG